MLFNKKTAACLTLLLAGSWWLNTGLAKAQNPVAMPYYVAPTVSPYVNLGYSPTGVSNYQSFVRPQIEEREALNRQAATLSKLQTQIQDLQRKQVAPAAKGKEPPARSPSGLPYMNYSHYYGTVR